MGPDSTASANPGYAWGQLRRALETATSSEDAAVRTRAVAKAERWAQVLDGMANGDLRVGSRAPVLDTPVWVTLEVAHGGFATGRYLAEQPLDDVEYARLPALPTLPTASDRERLNLWALTDRGQSELLAALSEGRVRLDLPEHGALLCVALLLHRGQAEAALDLVAELRPWLRRLRFTPVITEQPQAAGTVVHLESVGAVTALLRSAEPPRQLAAMLATLRVWNPLYDDLVALWVETVEGDLPTLDTTAEPSRVVGGWPCRRFPADWGVRRAALLERYAHAQAHHADAGTRHEHRRSNFTRLARALELCEVDSSRLSARDVGWVRRALANTVSRDGAPGTQRRAALRAVQAVAAARPTYARVAGAVAARLDRYPADGGLPALEPVVDALTDGELADAPAGTAVPPSIATKVARALDAPLAELVDRGIVTSGDVLARLLPQVSAQHVAAAIADPLVADLYARTYTAFRRRRSLLLLDLEHQVRFTELPWVAALSRFRTPSDAAHAAAREALRETVLLALRAFPERILPNPLVREVGSLASAAGLRLPLVEEVAADIFMGTFTTKWRDAARVASETLAGTTYARYYTLPATWPAPAEPTRTGWLRRAARMAGPATADDFAAVCASRAVEAGYSRGGWSVAGNGAVLEQSQILTTQNLAVAVTGLGLTAAVQAHALELAERCFAAVLQGAARMPREHHPRLVTVKNMAYAWRQGICFLSLAEPVAQGPVVTRLAAAAATSPLTGLPLAVRGLQHVLDGGSFGADGSAPGGGRRLLGWSVGPHWLLPAPAQRS